MQELLNPYGLARNGVSVEVVRGARAVAAAVAGAALVAGCSASPVQAPPTPTTAVPPPFGPATSPPAPPPTTPAGSPAPVPADGSRVQLQKAGADHTVVRGDTLSELAVTFRVPGGWPTLFERNRDVLWDPDLVLVGQQLDIDGLS